MRSGLTLKPGQRGTKELLEKYGSTLLYVRYRYDETRGVRLKTVELVVEEKQWQPPFRRRDTDVVPVMVSFMEKDLRDQLKSVGATWDPEAKLWMVPYGLIRGTKLEEKIPKSFIKRRERRASKHLI